MLLVSGRQISNYLLAFGSIKNKTDLDSSLLPQLACFIVHHIDCPCFRFVWSWIIGLAIGETMLIAGEVIVDLSR